MPSLKIDQSDLKCKNGCDYFGNPQWQGYCSKCHREQLNRQRRAEKAEKASSGTLPKPEQKKPERGLKLASHSSFSKFEEKRLRQSETLKKANLLKFTVFKKSNNADEQEHTSERRPPQFKVPAAVLEGMKSDFRARFPHLPHYMDRDARFFVHTFITDVINHCHLQTVDELSERVQRQYQRFMKYMESSPLYSMVDSDTREKLIDFVEKHAMSYLHELPSVVFSPCGTEDERLDRVMSERIQQLGWVGERQLECRLDRGRAQCRTLLYRAISELLGMDSATSPGGKLQRVRRACRHVLALCGDARAPASADDLLPALILTVLKANPPRLVSNINFVTRFCNAQRLMTGEGGYYFTNLCCAVSFIENLSAESLSMDQKEFDCYMAMPASIGGSAWAAALSLCGATREADELRVQADLLEEEIKKLREDADQLGTNADVFEQEITKKVQDVLAKTPLELQPRRELPRLAPPRAIATLVDLTSPPPTETFIAEPQNLAAHPQTLAEEIQTLSGKLQAFSDEPHTAEPQALAVHPQPQTELQGNNKEVSTIPEIKSAEKPAIHIFESKQAGLRKEVYHFDTPNLSPSKSPLLDQPWGKQTNSLELLTPSPLGFAPFDRSMDELLTPDEFGAEHVAPGLSNINYDIDLSDFSGDNSLAEDPPKEPKDPFSPDGLKKFDPFAPQPSRAACSAVLEKFDEFNLDSNNAAEAFEVVHRSEELFSSIPDNEQKDPFSPVHKESRSILDDAGLPTDCLLPSPLQPQTSKRSS